MLLTITYTGQNTIDLGYLLYKNPYRQQVFQLNYGKAYVFYPEVSNERTTAALLLEIDPIDLARGKVGTNGGGLFDYVNDRPYVSSSFMSTAISRVFGTALTGRADEHQELSDSLLDLTAVITQLPCHGEQDNLNKVFEPLGYQISYETSIMDEAFPEWGESKYVNLTIRGTVRLRDLLKHLFVCIPVFDRQKHYWVGADEVDKLLRMGEEWLPAHPSKNFITGRYLNKRRSLVNKALEQLVNTGMDDLNKEDIDKEESTFVENETEDSSLIHKQKEEKKLDLNTRRLNAVVDALKHCGARRILDIGCGEGKLLSRLLPISQFTNIVGADVSFTILERAKERLKLDRTSDYLRNKVQLFQASLTYKDSRFSGYDAICVVEVVEHLDRSRITAFERVLFEFARPPIIILTTPNKEYNANYTSLYDDMLRHGDHRFEWTRKEFHEWGNRIAEKFGYQVEYSEIGDQDETYGTPTQMGVFKICG